MHKLVGLAWWIGLPQSRGYLLAAMDLPVTLLEQLKGPPPVVQELKAEMPASFVAAADEADRVTDAWIERGKVARSALKDWRAEIGDQAFVPQAEQLVAFLEQRAEEFAAQGARAEKAYRRDIKRAFQISPAAGVQHRQLAERLMAAAKRNLEEQLDFALFMRAQLAEARSAEIVATFEDPDELAAFLDRLTA